MNTCLVTIEADHNSRVQAGLYAIEELWALDEGYSVLPSGVKSYIKTTLEVDFGRYDSEGESYICDLLNCLPGDIHFTYIDSFYEHL